MVEDGCGLQACLSNIGIHLRQFACCQVQMRAAQLNPCLLTGWDIDFFIALVFQGKFIILIVHRNF